MPKSIVRDRVEVGVFNLRPLMRRGKSIFYVNFKTSLAKCFFHLCVIAFLVICGDVELNRGGVCVYFKESLVVRSLTSPNLKKYLLLEVFIHNEKGYVVLL